MTSASYSSQEMWSTYPIGQMLPYNKTTGVTIPKNDTGQTDK